MDLNSVNTSSPSLDQVSLPQTFEALTLVLCSSYVKTTVCNWFLLKIGTNLHASRHSSNVNTAKLIWTIFVTSVSLKTIKLGYGGTPTSGEMWVYFATQLLTINASLDSQVSN